MHEDDCFPNSCHANAAARRCPAAKIFGQFDRAFVELLPPLGTATAALTDPAAGLFSAASMAIGQPLFTSQVEAALLADGVHAVRSLSVADGGGRDIFSSEPVGRADPGEGSFYVLAASAITSTVDDG